MARDQAEAFPHEVDVVWESSLFNALSTHLLIDSLWNFILSDQFMTVES